MPFVGFHPRHKIVQQIPFTNTNTLVLSGHESNTATVPYYDADAREYRSQGFAFDGSTWSVQSA